MIAMRSLFIAAAIGASFAANSQILKPSMKDQVRLGQQAAAQLRKEAKIIDKLDPRSKLLADISERLMLAIPEKDLKGKPWQFSFDLIEDKSINAFALPGGPCYVFTGLVAKVKTEDQLAGVIAHEIVHVLREHWARDYAKSQETSLGILVIGTILNVNRDIFQLVSIADVLTSQLPRSRKYETEADEFGFDLMVNAGYNPQGMIDIFKMLQQQKGGTFPEFMSDHPDEKNRIKKLEERLAKLKKDFQNQTPIPASIRALSLRTSRIGKPN